MKFKYILKKITTSQGILSHAATISSYKHGQCMQRQKLISCLRVILFLRTEITISIHEAVIVLGHLPCKQRAGEEPFLTKMELCDTDIKF